MRKSDNRLRITVQLIEAARGFHLWSESYDREFRDVFSIQEEIARNVVRSLRVTLSPQEKGALAEIPTSHVQAYDYYLRGSGASTTATGTMISSSPFSSSRGRPSSTPDTPWPTPAWPTAGPISISTPSGRTPSASRPRPRAAGPSSSRPNPPRPRLPWPSPCRSADHKEEAQAAFEKAIRLDPTLFEAWYFYARQAFAGGDLPKAASLYEEAMRVRPDDFYSPLLVAQVYDELGRPDDARAARERGVALVEKRIDLHPDDARALYMGANGLVALGEKEKGLDWARRARRIDPDDPMLLYNLGCIHSLAGDLEDAIDCLERAASGGLLQKGWYEHDGDLDPLRSHPRFKALLERM